MPVLLEIRWDIVKLHGGAGAVPRPIRQNKSGVRGGSPAGHNPQKKRQNKEDRRGANPAAIHKEEEK